MHPCTSLDRLHELDNIGANSILDVIIASLLAIVLNGSHNE